MSETKDTKSSPAHRVFLWTVPRSLSTILVKCLSYVEQIQVINEPYVDAYYYGPERKTSKRSVEDKFERAFQKAGKSVSNVHTYDGTLSTYDSVKQLLEADYDGKKLVFCKDHAYCLNSLHNMLPVGYKHTYLIRHPQKAFISLKKITESITQVDLSQRDIQDFPDPFYYGYQRLYNLMEYRRDKGEPQPIIIDADDLQTNPESILRQYCQAIGIPFKQSLLEWEPGLHITDSWITSQQSKGNNYLCDGGFYSVAFKSTTFQPPSTHLHDTEVPKELLPVIDASLPFYELMHKLRIKP